MVKANSDFVIKSASQYNEVLQRFGEIFNAKKNTKESKEADHLATAITDYERKLDQKRMIKKSKK